MTDDVVTNAIAGDWHSEKVVVQPDAPYIFRNEEFYKPMTDDIVTRLRAMCEGHTHSVSQPCVVAQAAEEIIWLRNDRNGWKARAMELDAQWVKEHGHG